jgi:hypothetical protein
MWLPYAGNCLCDISRRAEDVVTDSMEHIPDKEASSCLASQDISHYLWTLCLHEPARSVEPFHFCAAMPTSS